MVRQFGFRKGRATKIACMWIICQIDNLNETWWPMIVIDVENDFNTI